MSERGMEFGDLRDRPGRHISAYITVVRERVELVLVAKSRAAQPLLAHKTRAQLDALS